jgi:hypothetical protein
VTQSAQQTEQGRRSASDLLEKRFDQETGFDQSSVETDDQRNIVDKPRGNFAGFGGPI